MRPRSRYASTPIGTPIVSRGVVCFFSGGKSLCAVDVKTGKTRWTLKIGMGSSPSVYGSLLLVQYREVLTALDRQTGALKWELQLPSRTVEIPTVVADGTAVIFCAGTGELVGVDLAPAEAQYRSAAGKPAQQR